LLDYTLITGASSEIGGAIARRVSAAGPLLLGGRDTARLNEAAAAAGRTAVAWQCDLANVPAIRDSLIAAIPAGATVGTFIHCAGTLELLPARSVCPDVAQSIFAVNVLSAIEIVRTLLSRRSNPGGLKNIVFVSSIFSVRGARGNSVYAASKGALDALMRSLALELAPAVRVNSVLPGAIETRMSADAFADGRLAAEYPLGTGAPSDVAGATAFLLSPEDRWITGQALIVDGGRTAR
jgi:NAD(P)-dependent dehydrogenase (short-subunit alcohol dehydrogenase family)